MPPQGEEKISTWEGVGLHGLGWKAVLVGGTAKPRQGVRAVVVRWGGVVSEVGRVWEGPVEGKGPSPSSSLKWNLNYVPSMCLSCVLMHYICAVLS